MRKSFVVLYEFFNDFLHFYKVNFLRPKTKYTTNYEMLHGYSFIFFSLSLNLSLSLALISIATFSKKINYKFCNFAIYFFIVEIEQIKKKKKEEKEEKLCCRDSRTLMKLM
jgi:hypothetical protein